jgi:hypothetical protein
VHQLNLLILGHLSQQLIGALVGVVTRTGTVASQKHSISKRERGVARVVLRETVLTSAKMARRNGLKGVPVEIRVARDLLE